MQPVNDGLVICLSRLGRLIAVSVGFSVKILVRNLLAWQCGFRLKVGLTGGLFNIASPTNWLSVRSLAARFYFVLIYKLHLIGIRTEMAQNCAPAWSRAACAVFVWCFDRYV
jgi:hypothetical protein